MPYGSVLTDEVQSSTANTPPTFKDGNGTQVGTLCRAWVNFNGTGTVAIRSSFNVSSITDNGTGDYTVNFTNALPDTNFTGNVTIGDPAYLSNTGLVYAPAATVTTTTYRLKVLNSSNSANIDKETIQCVFFR